MPQVQILEGVPSFGQKLGRGLGSGISQGLTQSLEEFHKKRQLELETNKFQKLGYPEPLARLAAGATVGGKTEVLKEVLDEFKRGNLGQFPINNQNIQDTPERVEDNEIQSAIQKSRLQDQGLTAKEKIARSAERYKTGLPVFQEAGTKLRGMSRDKERIQILDNLNESKRLPHDFGRLNVDKDGNLHFAFATTPEAQRFVKTLNEFSAGAKDTFGSRVTNFDLQQYLQRFPTLLNSEEGRRQILQQMKIVNDINSIYYKNLKKVYDSAGGVRNIDSDVAESIAEKRSENEIDKLSKKFDTIGQFTTLPDPSKMKGATFIDDETGEKLRSDGKNWIPVN
jgi:hypothetical protein